MEALLNDKNEYPLNRKGEVITFFSYKGGTGRTMALANIAVLLHKEIKHTDKILIIDWDLEAPGLDRYFFGDALRSSKEKPNGNQTQAQKPGLIDYFKEIYKVTKKHQPVTEADYYKIFDQIPLSDYTLPIEKFDRLFLMKAGRFDDKYAYNVNSFRWNSLFNRCPDLFSNFANYLANEYRYILIDSRTGITDTSSICTSLMPEKLVLVFTPNQQSLTGIEELVEKATDVRRQSDDLRPLLSYPLPSRIDLTHKEQERVAWRKGDRVDGLKGYQPLFEQLFKKVYGLGRCDLEAYFTEVQIQHVAELAYGEKIITNTVGDEDRFSVKRSYEALLNWMKNSYFPWETLEEAQLKAELLFLMKNLPLNPQDDHKIWPFLANAQKTIDIWRNEGRIHQASTVYQRICSVYRNILGQDHPDTLAVTKQLASTLSLTGDYLSAKTLQEYVFERRKNLYGLEHPDTLASMGDLAGTLCDLGDFKGAKSFQLLVLKNRKKHFGPDHPDTLTSTSNLASTLSEMGDYKKARSLQQGVLEKRIRLLGSDHPDTITSIKELASTLSDIGDYQKAKSLQENVLEKRTLLLGPDHPDTLTSLNDLANTLSEMGDHQKAKTLQENVLERRIALLGPDHPDTLTSMNNLSSTLSDEGDHQRAKVLQEIVLERRMAQFGLDHPDTLTSMSNLASTLSDMGDHQKAKELQERVLERRTALLGPNHPATLSSMNNLAGTLSEKGDYRKAKVLQERVLTLRKKLLGPDHPDTLTSMSNLAMTLWGMGKLHAAKLLEEKVLERRKQKFGSNHPDTLTSMNNLAGTLSDVGDLQGSIALQEYSLERIHELLGPRHPNTTTSAWNLFMTLREKGDRVAAKAVMDKHLSWLLTDVNALYSAYQKQIRDMLRMIVTKKGHNKVLSPIVDAME